VTRAHDDLRVARRALTIEARAIDALAGRLGVDFVRSVEILGACPGRVVVTGLGKSGLICRKIAATLASTGTPSFFLHASEALHGDLGMMMRGDALIALSYSGGTSEVLGLVEAARRLALPVIAMTGQLESPLARLADVLLDVSVAEEACPLGLAPTASTTVSLALGDALAVALLERRGFQPEDFGNLHPGGSLGRRLMGVSELMHSGGEVPLVPAEASLAVAIEEMSRKGFGLTGVVDSGGRLLGIITDGDLRRAVQGRGDLRAVAARDVMTRNPKTVRGSSLAAHALAEMERFRITALFIVDESDRPVGVLHLHDLLRAGVV
jgi:arabinose-5-phosphate isomerase